jgi:multiple sugar transport system substrate-binding protein
MTTRLLLAAVAAGTLVVAGACGSGFNDSGKTQQSTGPASIQIMIASSGDAETKAVQDAAAA